MVDEITETLLKKVVGVMVVKMVWIPVKENHTD
jgi:hypothetical protein